MKGMDLGTKHHKDTVHNGPPATIGTTPDGAMEPTGNYSAEEKLVQMTTMKTKMEEHSMGQGNIRGRV